MITVHPLLLRIARAAASVVLAVPTVLAAVWYVLPIAMTNYVGCSAPEPAPNCVLYTRWSVAREFYLVSDPTSAGLWLFWLTVVGLVALSAWGWFRMLRGKWASFLGIHFAGFVALVALMIYQGYDPAVFELHRHFIYDPNWVRT